jgi:hypothetical protein
MSSGSRRGPSEENILAMLERDAARRRLSGNPRFAWYAAGGALALSLVGALAWLMHENNSANDMLHLADQPGVSVAVVPDKPGPAAVQVAAPYPAFSDEPQANVHTVAAATIIDNPEPAAPTGDEPRLAAKPAQAPAAHAVAKPKQPETPQVAPKPTVVETPRVAAKAPDGVPALVLLSASEAAKARAAAPPRAAQTKVAVRAPAPIHEAKHGARPAATAKSTSPTRDERRVAARERAGDTATPAHASRAAKPIGRARAAVIASATPKNSGKRNAAPPNTRKAAADTHAAPVDTDVALISAIIAHADGRTKHADPCASSTGKKCAGKGGSEP